MNDITERLEHYAKKAMPHYPNDLCSEAKREIERLRSAPAQDAGASDPIAWIKATYLMWLKGDLEPEHMRLGQNFFDARRAAAARTPAEGDSPPYEDLRKTNVELMAKLRDARAQVENANKRWEAVHDMVHRAREMVRLQIDAKDRPEGLFQTLQDALYAIRGRETSNV